MLPVNVLSSAQLVTTLRRPLWPQQRVMGPNRFRSEALKEERSCAFIIAWCPFCQLTIDAHAHTSVAFCFAKSYRLHPAYESKSRSRYSFIPTRAPERNSARKYQLSGATPDFQNESPELSILYVGSTSYPVHRAGPYVTICSDWSRQTSVLFPEEWCQACVWSSCSKSVECIGTTSTEQLPNSSLRQAGQRF